MSVDLSLEIAFAVINTLLELAFVYCAIFGCKLTLPLKLIVLEIALVASSILSHVDALASLGSIFD